MVCEKERLEIKSNIFKYFKIKFINQSLIFTIKRNSETDLWL